MPLVLIWPEMKLNLDALFWICDAVWFISIPLDFVTIRSNLGSRDNFDIAVDYVKTELLFDLAALVPTVAT